MSGKMVSPSLHSILSRGYRSLILLALILASGTIIASSAVAMIQHMERSLHLTARTVAYTVEPAIVFGDVAAVREGMASVATGDMVDRLVIVGADGKEMARSTRSFEGLIPPAILQFGNDVLFSTPAKIEIARNGKVIAKVLVFGSSSAMIRFLFSGIVIVVCCVGIAMLATSILARRLHSGVIDPLNHAVEVARSVRVERAFSRRVPAPGLREVDNFVEDFNSLLSELQSWYEGLTQENRQLERRATHDPLTGVGNRALFEQRLEQAIGNAREQESGFALLYLDGDGFKRINDTYGHDAGDAVLRAVSERLSSCIRNADHVYRLGGDEFAVILTSPVGPDEVASVVERIGQTMRFPITIPSHGFVHMSLSVGCALYPTHGRSAAELCKMADEAMYRDKLRRRNNDLASSL